MKAGRILGDNIVCLDESDSLSSESLHVHGREMQNESEAPEFFVFISGLKLFSQSST